MAALTDLTNSNPQEPQSSRTGASGLLLLPIGIIFVCHYLVDTYSATMQPLLGVVQTEFGMKPQWAAVLLD